MERKIKKVVTLLHKLEEIWPDGVSLFAYVTSKKDIAVSGEDAGGIVC